MVETLLEREERDRYCSRDGIGTAIDVEWPDFTKSNTFVQLFTKGSNVRKITKPIPAIEETWEKYEALLKPCSVKIERYHSDYNLINYCAKTFQTAFMNNLRSKFVSNQRRAVREELIRRSSQPKSTTVYALQCFINGWAYRGRT